MISPNTTITAVEIKKPLVPPKISAVRMESIAFTATLPRRRVQRSWLPLARTGAMRLAFALATFGDRVRESLGENALLSAHWSASELSLSPVLGERGADTDTVLEAVGSADLTQE